MQPASPLVFINFIAFSQDMQPVRHTGAPIELISSASAWIGLDQTTSGWSTKDSTR